MAGDPLCFSTPGRDCWGLSAEVHKASGRYKAPLAECMQELSLATDSLGMNHEDQAPSSRSSSSPRGWASTQAQIPDSEFLVGTDVPHSWGLTCTPTAMLSLSLFPFQPSW